MEAEGYDDGYGYGDGSGQPHAVPDEDGAGSMDLDDLPVTQEDAWAVISAYFEEKGLVRQQLDLFDEFI